MFVLESPGILIRNLLSYESKGKNCVKASTHAKNMYFDPKNAFFHQTLS